MGGNAEQTTAETVGKQVSSSVADSTDSSSFPLIDFLTGKDKDGKKGKINNEIAATEFFGNVPFVIENLPKFYLSLHDMSRLSRTCKPLYTFFKPVLDEAREQAKELVQAVVGGDRAKVKKMLDANPQLLYVKVGEIIGLTALQLAIRTQTFNMGVDSNNNPKNDDVIELLELYFKKLQDGKTELAKQIAEEKAQFDKRYPKCLLDNANAFNFSAIVNAITAASPEDIQRVLQPAGFDFSAIINAINAVFQEDIQRVREEPRVTDTAISKELAAFRVAFRQQSLRDERFNPNHLRKAFRVYLEQYVNWNEFQRKLFCVQVRDFAKRFVPALVAEKEGRTVWPVFIDVADAFDLPYKSPVVRSQLGFNYYLQPGFPISSHLTRAEVRPTFNFFMGYIEQRQQNLSNLTAQLQSPEPEIDSNAASMTFSNT